MNSSINIDTANAGEVAVGHDIYEDIIGCGMGMKPSGPPLEQAVRQSGCPGFLASEQILTAALTMLESRRERVGSARGKTPLDEAVMC